MLTSLAVVLLGIYVIVASQEPVSSTLALIFGLAAAILALLDLLGGQSILKR